MEATLASVASTWRQLEDRSAAELEGLRQELRASMREVDAVTRELHDSASVIEDLETSLAAEQARTDEFQTQAVNLQAKLVEADSQAQKLHDSLTQSRSDGCNAQSQFLALTQRSDEKTSLLRQERFRNNRAKEAMIVLLINYEQQLQLSLAIQERLLNEKDESQAEMQQAQAQVTSLSTELQHVTTAKQQLNLDKNAMETELQKQIFSILEDAHSTRLCLEQSIAEYEDEVAELAAALDEQEEDVDDAAVRYEDEAASNAKLLAAKSKADKQIETLLAEIEVLKHDLADEKDAYKIDQLGAQLEHEEQMMAAEFEHEAQIESVNCKNEDKIQAVILEFEARITAADLEHQNQIKAVKVELESQVATHDRFKADVDRLWKAEKDSHAAEVSHWKQSVDDHVKQISQLKDSVDDQLTQIGTLKTSLDHIHARQTSSPARQPSAMLLDPVTLTLADQVAAAADDRQAKGSADEAQAKLAAQEPQEKTAIVRPVTPVDGIILDTARHRSKRVQKLEDRPDELSSSDPLAATPLAAAFSKMTGRSKRRKIS